jgi:cell division protein FtsB
MIRSLEKLTQRGVRRGIVWAMALALIVVATWVFMGTVDFRNEGLVEARLEETQARAQALARENAVLRLRILELRLGSKETERAAREEHGLIRPDEVLFVFEGHR